MHHKLILLTLTLLLLTSCATGPSHKEINGPREAHARQLIETFQTLVWTKPLNQILPAKIGKNGWKVIDIPRPINIHGYPTEIYGGKFANHCNPTYPNIGFKFQIYYEKDSNGLIYLSGYLGYQLQTLENNKCRPWNVRVIQQSRKAEYNLPVARLELFTPRNSDKHYSIYTKKAPWGDLFNPILKEQILPKGKFKNVSGTITDNSDVNYFFGPRPRWRSKGHFNYATNRGRLSRLSFIDIPIDPNLEMNNSLSEIVQTRMNIDHFVKAAVSAAKNRDGARERAQRAHNRRVEAEWARDRARKREYDRQIRAKFKDSGSSSPVFSGVSDAQFDANLMNTYAKALNNMRSNRKNSFTAQARSNEKNNKKGAAARGASPAKSKYERCSRQDPNCIPKLVVLCRDDKITLSCFNSPTKFAQGTWTPARPLNVSASMECAQNFKLQNASVVKSFSVNKGLSDNRKSFASPMTACWAECNGQAEKYKLKCR